MRARSSLLALLLLTGCDNFGELARLKPRRVPVALVDTYRQADGGVQTRVPAATLEGWVDLDGIAEPVHIDGACDAGQCELRNVPPGTLLLHRSDGPFYAEVDDSPSYDMGKDGFYRLHTQTGAGTRLTVTMTGASPLSARTWLQVRVPDYPVSVQNRPAVAAGQLVSGFAPETPSGATGATSFSYQFPWSSLPLLTMEPLEVYQLEPAGAPGALTRYEVTKRGAPLVSIVDGRDVGVTAALENVGAGDPVAGVSYDFSQLVAEVLRDDKVSIVGAMSLLDVGPAGDSAAVTVAAEYRTAAPWSLSTAGTSIDPFPGRPKTVTHGLQLFYRRQLGTSDSHLPLSASLSGPSDSNGWHGTTLLGPPRDVALSPEREEGVLESLTPTLTWTAPAFGTANRYWVLVYDVKPTPEVLLPQIFVLYRPRLRLPPGVLEAGGLYAFWVWSVNCDAAPLNAPLREPPQPTCASAQLATRVYKTPQ